MSSLLEIMKTKESRAAKAVGKELITKEAVKALGKIGLLALVAYGNKKVASKVVKDIKGHGECMAKTARDYKRCKNESETSLLKNKSKKKKCKKVTKEDLIKSIAKNTGLIVIKSVGGVFLIGASAILGARLALVERNSTRDFNDEIDSKYREKIYELEEEEFELGIE